MISQFDNPLVDKEFLKQLDANKQREVYARIVALTFDETPIELIEGVVTGGSINIDGTSAVRRTCSLSLVAKDIDINDFYWGIKSKFKLEIGLKNTVDTKRYPDIIWFPQGTFVIASFNTSNAVGNCSISISGKDKMCLLNGDLGGNLTASIDFGTEEFLDKTTNTVTYVKVPIEKIIRESLHAYALEPYHNIVINDLDDAAVELLEYRGDKPLYLLRDHIQDQFENYTLNGDMKIKIVKTDENNNIISKGDPINLADLEENEGHYDPRIELAPEAQQIKPSIIQFTSGTETLYTVAKIEYGQTVGYRNTELVYAGDLISNVGETLVSIYDKIKNMLGNYEYFYDIDGRFIFQRKRTYIYNAWENIINTGDEEYVDNAALSSAITYTFEGSTLITSFQNSPSLSNLKNDYSVWGERESASGAKIPIHYRYAIDYKPKYYTSLEITDDDIKEHNDKYGETATIKTQTSETYFADEVDWRELIYQMALDYYQYNQLDCYATELAKANRIVPEKRESESDKDFEQRKLEWIPLYQNGKTGYEQYYIDLQGFWRQLYNSNPDPNYNDFSLSGSADTFTYEGSIPLCIKGTYKKIDSPIPEKHSDYYVLLNGELQPWLDAIYIPNYDNDNDYKEKTESSIAGTDKYSQTFYRKVDANEYEPIAWSIRKQFNKSEVYVLDSGSYVPLIKSKYNKKFYTEKDEEFYKFNDDGKFYEIKEINDTNLKNLYITGENIYNRYLVRTELDRIGSPIENNLKKTNIHYYTKDYDYIVGEGKENLYWTTDLINNPAGLNFWFDFLDAESELGQFSVPAVGDRAKAVKDNDVKAIYFRQVPNLIFTTYEDYMKDDMKKESGYIPVLINGSLENLFNISAQGKSAQERIDELLYNHSYCIENITIQAIPIYYLQPNTRIFVKDEDSKVEGEYIISRISIPLQYNGMMSITASKAPERIY